LNRDLDGKIRRLEQKLSEKIEVASLGNFEAKNEWKNMYKRLSDFDQTQE
jgi:hypothetical protein